MSHIFAFISLNKLPCSSLDAEERFINNLHSDNCYPDSLFLKLSVQGSDPLFCLIDNNILHIMLCSQNLQMIDSVYPKEVI